MGLHYENLDDVTRSRSIDELDRETSDNSLYTSPRLSPTGVGVWPILLRAALLSGTDDSLALEIAVPGILNLYEESHRNGVPYRKKVPANAASTLAEGEFNRYYLRGLAARAVDEGRQIEVYRGRPSANPRTASEELIGRRLDPHSLLADLRSSIYVDPALGLPPGPNSGLTGRLV